MWQSFIKSKCIESVNLDLLPIGYLNKQLSNEAHVQRGFPKLDVSSRQCYKLKHEGMFSFITSLCLRHLTSN